MITDQQANCTSETSKTDHKGKYRTLIFLTALNKFCVIFLFPHLQTTISDQIHFRQE